ncbi:MAG: PEP-CTERM sorting domain-containing protein, partial [Rubripirellula sp.]
YTTPAQGDTFDLWDVTGTTTNTFATVNLPTLAEGLQWNTSQLYSAGVLSVTVAAVPEPSSLAFLAVGLMTVVTRRRRRITTA